LSRVAIGESAAGLPLSQYYEEALDVAWSVRLDAFIDLMKYGTSTYPYPPGIHKQPITGASHAGETVDLVDDIVLSGSYSSLKDFGAGRTGPTHPRIES
jgi:hypothetical protein